MRGGFLDQILFIYYEVSLLLSIVPTSLFPKYLSFETRKPTLSLPLYFGWEVLSCFVIGAMTGLFTDLGWG